MAKKRRIKKIIMHRHPSPSKLEELVDNLGKRMGQQEELFDKLAKAQALKTGTMVAQLQEFMGSLNKLNANVMVTVGLVKEILGQITVIDEKFKLLDPMLDGKSLDDRIDTAAAVEQAKVWFRELEVEGFKQFMANEEEHKRKRQEMEDAKRAAAEEATKHTVENKESETVQKALIDAQTPSLAQTTAGPGSEVPEGAQIFGG